MFYGNSCSFFNIHTALIPMVVFFFFPPFWQCWGWNSELRVCASEHPDTFLALQFFMYMD